MIVLDYLSAREISITEALVMVKTLYIHYFSLHKIVRICPIRYELIGPEAMNKHTLFHRKLQGASS